MKSQPTGRCDCIIDEQGGVALSLRGRALPRHVSLVLDDQVVAVLAVPRGRAARVLRWALPAARLAESLDVLDAETGCSLLDLPVSLGPVYALDVAAAALAELCVSGGFTAAPFLAAALPVELVAAGEVMGRGLAQKAEDGWRYAVKLCALPEADLGAPLMLRVAGLARLLPTGIVLSCRALGMAGRLDAAVPARVEGWAVDLARPGSPVSLEVFVGTQRVAVAETTGARPDLAARGFNGARAGFSIALPDALDPRARKRVAVRIAGTQANLAASPVLIDPLPELAGRFDTLHGMSAHGWALDQTRPAQKVVVEAVGPGGEVLGSAVANGFRGDLLGAGLANGLCAFKIDLSAHYERLIGQDILVRFAGTQAYLPGSPHRILPNNNIQRFLRRRDHFRRKPWLLPRLKRALNHRARGMGISIIMPVFNTPRAWLSEALESVRHQFCDNWELICVDDGSSEPHIGEVLARYAHSDARIRVLNSRDNVGTARATNFALRAARHEYVMFLDHDDFLEPDAVWQMIRAIQLTGADLLYGDEALTDERLRGVLELRLRPAFSYDYYLSHPYFVHPVCVRTALARSLGGMDETLKISADVDLMLRVIEQAHAIAHVPAVLYRWRTHASSSGHSRQDEVTQATIGALQRHLDRLGTGATAAAGAWFNQYRIDWPEAPGRVLIVIPTKNGADLLRRAVESIEQMAAGEAYRLVVIDHDSDEPASCAYLRDIAARHVVMPYRGTFNFSKMNNEAVRRHGGDCDFVLFLNNDIEATQPAWIGRLRRLAARGDVGAVGALLMYPDRKVQHAGVVLGFNDSADHALRLQEVFLDEDGRRNLGYNCALTSVREYSAVTAACLMMRRAVFDGIGGFDVKYGIGFNDTDLCLRVRDAGYKVLYDGHTILYHFESATRSKTKQVFHPSDTKRMARSWRDMLRAGDPFYNPHLSLSTQDHVPREDSACRIVHAPRVSRGFLPRAAKPD